MDSDSDSNSSIRSSGTAAFRSSATIPPSPSPDDPQFERDPRGEQFLIVNHTANQRNGSEVSKIWLHGGECRRIDNGSNDSDVNRIRASLQQCEKAAYTREESAYGGHYRGMRMSKGLVEEGTYSTTEGLRRQRALWQRALWQRG